MRNPLVRSAALLPLFCPALLAQVFVTTISPSGGDDVPTIQAAIAAIQSRQSTAGPAWQGGELVFAAGTYQIHRSAGAPVPNGLIQIFGLRDVKLRAVAGAHIELVGFDRSVGDFDHVFNISGCENFTIEGASASQPLTIDMRRRASPAGLGGLNSVQATITRVHGNAIVAHIVDPEFFLPDAVGNPTAHAAMVAGLTDSGMQIWSWELTPGLAPRHAVYDFPGAGGFSAITIHPPANGTQRLDLTFRNATWGNGLRGCQFWQPGNQAVFVLGGTDNALFWGGGNTGTTTLRNVTIHHFPGKASMWGYTENLLADHLVVAPAVGNLASSRDGMSIWGLSGDLVVRDSQFVQTGDDGVQPRGTPIGTTFASAPGIAVLRPSVVHPDPMANEGLIAQAGDVVEWRPESWDRDAARRTTLGSIGDLGAGWRLVQWSGAPAFDAAIQSGPGHVLDVSRNCRSMLFERCLFQGMRGVGIHAVGPDITIRECTFSNIMLAGVFLGCGLTDIYPFNNGVFLCDRARVEACSFDQVNVDPLAPQFGAALFIGMATAAAPPPAPFAAWIHPSSRNVHESVTIEACSFANLTRGAVFVGNVHDLTIDGTSLDTVGGPPDPSWGMRDYWQYGITAYRCEKGTVSNTTAVNCYSAAVVTPESVEITVQ